MKTLTLFLALYSTLGLISQAIPNGGFEEWESTPMFTLDPVDWETDNTQLIVSTSQDLEPYQGNYAMRVDPINFGVGEYGEASTTIDMGGLPAGMNFYVKYQRTVTAALGVTVDFYYEEDIVHSEYWAAMDTASAWMPVQMTFPPIDIATTHAIIRVFVAVGDLVPGQGWISVDAMSFGLLSSVEESVISETLLFPNPVDQIIHIRTDLSQEIDEILVLDLNGRIVLKTAYIDQLHVGVLSKGQYVLELRKGVGVIARRTFLKN